MIITKNIDLPSLELLKGLGYNFVNYYTVNLKGIFTTVSFL